MHSAAIQRRFAWLLAIALVAAGSPSVAQQGQPGDRASVLAQLEAAITAVRTASAALERSQVRLVAVRANLESADKARLDAEQRLKASEAGAARGQLTRAALQADRAVADSAAAAVDAVRAEMTAVEAELTEGQAKLTAANRAADAAATSAAAYLGDPPAE